MTNIQINRYEALNPDQINILHKLYNNCFDLLKMTRDNFVKRLFWNDFKKIFFLAEIDKDIAGYLIIVNNSILLLIVDAKYRNKGIGSELLRKGEQEIKTKYEKINLVAPDYFLCGVPFDTKSSYYKWFENRGFMYDWTSFDMTVDLENFTYKEEDFTCSLDGIIFKKLGKNKDEVVSCYNGANSVEDGWREYFLKDDIEAIIAVKSREVIGGVIIPSFCLFDESLKYAGSFGVIWVLEKYRKKGVGMKLYSKSLFELKYRGYKTCHIGYTYLDSWYGKLGAKKYIDYWIGAKKL